MGMSKSYWKLTGGFLALWICSMAVIAVAGWLPGFLAAMPDPIRNRATILYGIFALWTFFTFFTAAGLAIISISWSLLAALLNRINSKGT